MPTPQPVRSPRLSYYLMVLALGAWACASDAVHGENWPQWRGPNGNSTSGERELPLVWNRSQNLAWQTKLPGWGNSTPAIWEDAIFVTAQEESRLLVLRISKADGKIVWTRELGTGTAPREGGKRDHKFHRLHNLASPSPVTDGQRVIVHFGNGLLAALDFQGEVLWQQNLQTKYGAYTNWWGHANSPVLYENLVISVCMQDSLADVAKTPSPSYLVAHDKRTGKEVWQTSRSTGADAEQGDAYTTPVFAQVQKRTDMIVMGANQLDGYDPSTGQRRWFLPGLIGGRTITGPTVNDQTLYTTIGMRGDLLALPLEPWEGEVPRRAIAWKYDQGTPDSCCPVVWRDMIFTVADNGIARCLDAGTGHLRWKERLAGEYKASPVSADGRIYFLNQSGVTTVVSAAPRFDKLVENALDDTTLASPAVSGGQFFFRGHDSLFCIGR